MLVFWLTVYSLLVVNFYFQRTVTICSVLFLIIFCLHYIFLSVIILIGIKASGHFFVLLFTLSILHGVFLTLYADTTSCWYPNAPTYCCPDSLMCRHTNAPTLHCFNKIYVKLLIGPWIYIPCLRKIESMLVTKEIFVDQNNDTVVKQSSVNHRCFPMSIEWNIHSCS
jgi:hypothetical protein